MAVVLGIGLCALLLTGGEEESQGTLMLRIQVGLSALLFGILAWWIRRGLKRRKST